MSGLHEGRDLRLRAMAGPGPDVVARVVRLACDLVVLELLSRVAGRTGLDPGSRVELRWKHRLSARQVQGVVEARGATLAVRLGPDRRRSQRRAYVRAPALLGVEVTTPAGLVVRGVVTEVSAAGIRARVPAPVAPGDRVDVAIALPCEEPVALAARIVRRHAGKVLGLVFVDPPERATDRLVRFVLASQQRAIARGRARREALAGEPAPRDVRRVGDDGRGGPDDVSTGPGA